MLGSALAPTVAPTTDLSNTIPSNSSTCHSTTRSLDSPPTPPACERKVMTSPTTRLQTSQHGLKKWVPWSVRESRADLVLAAPTLKHIQNVAQKKKRSWDTYSVFCLLVCLICFLFGMTDQKGSSSASPTIETSSCAGACFASISLHGVLHIDRDEKSNSCAACPPSINAVPFGNSKNSATFRANTRSF